MNHIKRITLAQATAKDMDHAGILFLQLWATVMAFMIAGALGKE